MAHITAANLLAAQDIWQSVANFFKNFAQGGGLNIVRAAAFAALGLVLLKVVRGITRRVALKSKLDHAAATFVISIVTVVLYIALTIVVVSSLGLSAAGIIAAFSAIALAVALALQNTLASLANGVLIIFTKPFKKGDCIEIGGIEGIVQSIKLFNTKILTFNNEEIIIPNSDILSKTLTNQTAMPLRRAQVVFYVSYSADIQKLSSDILAELSKNPAVLSSPAPSVIFDSFGEYTLCFKANAWTDIASYYPVKAAVKQVVYAAIRANGAEPSMRRMSVDLSRAQGAELTKTEEGENE